MCKIKEVFLVICIEQLLNKDEIFELYLNKIYFGYCVYGVGVVVQVYFGKFIDQLILSEMVVIVGLLKVFFIFNLFYLMDCVIVCCNVVLLCMLSEGYIIQV